MLKGIFNLILCFSYTAIDCGIPAVNFDSEQYILLNGTTYGSVALQQCGTQETTLTCREDGTWSPSDLDCAEQSE